MILDSRANNGLFGSTNLPTYFTNDQVLSLEGDFDQYFTLYCPRQYERDALYVFTPDLMALLIDEAAPFDVEIVDEWMFVYSSKPFDPLSRLTYERLFRIADTVGAKTLRQTKRYKDERVHSFAANIIAPQGRRLKSGVSVGAVVVMVAFAVFWMWESWATRSASKRAVPYRRDAVAGSAASSRRTPRRLPSSLTGESPSARQRRRHRTRAPSPPAA